MIERQENRGMTVTYLNKALEPVSEDAAELVKVIFDDGETAWLVPSQDAAKAFNPNQPRDDRGRFGSGGSSAPVRSAADQERSAAEIKSFTDMVAKSLGDQPSAARVVNEHGKFYPFDDKSFAGSKKTLGGCYKYAGRAALNDHQLTYVEGYVSVHGVPISHAWTVDKSGVVRDPTLPDAKGILGYYGVPFKTDYLMKTSFKTGVWGLISHTNPDLLNQHPREFLAKSPLLVLFGVGALAKYSDDQPRDARGRFSLGGGGGDRPTLDHLFSDNMGIERKDMPQIPNKMKSTFLAELKDDNIGVNREYAPARDLKATQQNFNAEEIERVREGLANGGLKTNPIIVSNDDRVLDGHHRWAIRAQDGGKIDAWRVDLPMSELLGRARSFNTRYGVEARKGFWDDEEWDLAKYNPDQPRDDHGRFGSGGGGSAGNTDYASIRDGTGRTMGDLLAAGAGRGELESHPAFTTALRDAAAIKDTEKYEGYGTHEFRQGREFVGPDGKTIKGYDAASDHLMKVATAYAGEGGVKNGREATIIIGLPASGKSTVAERIAAGRGAAIPDPDDAKKIFSEYRGGIGANAVHEESSLLAASVLKRLTDQGANVIIPKVGPNIGSIQKLTDALKGAGYTVNLMIKSADPDAAYLRMVHRFLGTGRLVSGRYISDVDHKPDKVYRELAATGQYASTEIV